MSKDSVPPVQTLQPAPDISSEWKTLLAYVVLIALSVVSAGLVSSALQLPDPYQKYLPLALILLSMLLKDLPAMFGVKLSFNFPVGTDPLPTTPASTPSGSATSSDDLQAAVRFILLALASSSSTAGAVSPPVSVGGLILPDPAPVDANRAAPATPEAASPPA